MTTAYIPAWIFDNSVTRNMNTTNTGLIKNNKRQGEMSWSV